MVVIVVVGRENKMVTWREIEQALLQKSIDDMNTINKKGREYRLIDIFSAMEKRTMIFTESYAEIYLGLRTAYDSGYEARKAEEKD